jgi:hypothetical protein
MEPDISSLDSMCFLAVRTAGKITDLNEIYEKIGFESLQTAKVNKALQAGTFHWRLMKFSADMESYAL